jgi:chemotaxis protein MotB
MKSKKKHSEEADAPDLIMVMTVSLFIILLAFFILLNTIAVIDEQKKLAVMDSLIGSFGVMTGGRSVVEGQGGVMTLPDMQILSSHVDFSDMIVGAEDIIQLIRVNTDYRGTVMTIPAHLLFERGDTQLIPSGLKFLDRLGETLRKNTYPVEIAVHTDNRPPYHHLNLSNRELSTLRASTIFHYLMREKGLKVHRLSAFGWGGYRPIVSNKTKETREINRRVEIVFIHEAKPEKPKGIFTFRKFFFNVLD